jgi:hypothetical protein
MIKYKLISPLPPVTASHAVQRLPDGACIPFAEGNTDYAEYLAWLGEGNEPLPVDAPQVQSLESPVPSTDASVDAE